MGNVYRLLALALLAWTALAQDARQDSVFLTAVHTLSDHHTARWTSDPDPLKKVDGVCRIVPGGALFTLSCAAAPAIEPRIGRRQYYGLALFRDLEENLYMAACAATARNTLCDDVRAGQTFSAEVEGQSIRVVVRGEQLAMRILENRPRPQEIDSPTRGTPSQVKPAPGTPSNPSWSRPSVTDGAPSVVKPSDVSAAAPAASIVAPSETSIATSSPTAARLHVNCSNGAAWIFVDSRLIGSPPVEVPVRPGPHLVTVRVPGHRDWVQRVDVSAGRTTTVTAELSR